MQRHRLPLTSTTIDRRASAHGLRYVAITIQAPLFAKRRSDTVSIVDIAGQLRSVVIVSRLGEHAGFASDPVAYFDRYDAKAGRVVRHFVLLHESAKLMYEPWGWKGQWYVDIVRVIRESADTIRLQDLFIDVIVDGDGPTYRIIDLDDLARTMENGAMAHADVVAALDAAQQFLDNHLHRHRDFPPDAIRTWIQQPESGPFL